MFAAPSGRIVMSAWLTQLAAQAEYSVSYEQTRAHGHGSCTVSPAASGQVSHTVSAVYPATIATTAAAWRPAGIQPCG
jgi:hypothetical protein